MFLFSSLKGSVLTLNQNLILILKCSRGLYPGVEIFVEYLRPNGFFHAGHDLKEISS